MTLCSLPSLLAIEEHDRALARFQAYISAFEKLDFKEAAAFILPSDLEVLREAIVPVIKEAGSLRDPQSQAFVAIFFGETKGSARDRISGIESFAGVGRLMITADPNFAFFVRHFQPSAILLEQDSEDTAIVRYQIKTGDMLSSPASQNMVLVKGEWYLRLADDPRIRAKQMRQLLFRPGQHAP